MITHVENRVNDVNRAIGWVNNLFEKEEQYGKNWQKYKHCCNIGGNKHFSFLFAYNSSILAIIINSTVYFSWEDDGKFCSYNNEPFSISTAAIGDFIDILNVINDKLPKFGKPVYFAGTDSICHFGFDSSMGEG